MAEAAAWKARVRQRVASAHDRVLGAHNALDLARAFFNLPVFLETTPQGLVALAAGFRVKLVLALEQLTEATQRFNSAVVYMEAAEILALHGGNSADPSSPLASIQQLDLQHHAGVGLLQIARAMAEDACTLTQWCRGHLSTAIALVDSPHIPDAIVHVVGEQNNAYSALTEAIQRAAAALGEVTTARQILGA